MNMYVKHFWVFSFCLLYSSNVLSVPFNITYKGPAENNETTTNAIRFNILTANQNVNQTIFKRIKISSTVTEKNLSLNISGCDCGNNSVDCKYVSGIKICFCEKGYSANYEMFDTYCERCDCGPHAKSCEFVMSQKKCICQEGYAEFKKKCLRQKCDCGPNSVFCSLGSNNMKKQCYCKDGYDVEYNVYSHDHIMCKKCDCGIGASSCKLDYLGSRKCECESGYSKKKGILDESCEKCDCGPYAISCRYQNHYRKCNCTTGYEAIAVQSEEYCNKKITSVSGWKIATYILLGIFGIIFGIFVIIRNHNERTRL